jgi:hypothetical protein
VVDGELTFLEQGILTPAERLHGRPRRRLGRPSGPETAIAS